VPCANLFLYNRFHTIGTVFIAQAQGVPCAGDDAAGLKIIKLSQIADLQFAFDHKKILQDFNLRAAVSRRRQCRG
jgi:hypothetical protein